MNKEVLNRNQSKGHCHTSQSRSLVTTRPTGKKNIVNNFFQAFERARQEIKSQIDTDKN